MEKIDAKDRKILYYLDLDSRQSLTQIGKLVGLPKNVVSYRIKQLEKNGVIKNYFTVIDLHRIGYDIFRFYITYQYATLEIKKEIIDYFLKCKNIGILHHVEGSHDLVVYFFTKNIHEFHSFWTETLSKYRDYFSSQILTIYYQEVNLDYPFLIDQKGNRKKLAWGDKPEIEIDKIDLEILRFIAPNARISTSEIAKKLDISAVTAANRIKKLVDSGVINWFRVGIDFTKLGYTDCKVDIVLKDHKKLSQMLNYVEQNPNFYCRDVTLGYVDLELIFYLKNLRDIHLIMEDISVKFPNTIRSYKYVYVVQSYRIEYFPRV